MLSIFNQHRYHYLILKRLGYLLVSLDYSSYTLTRRINFANYGTIYMVYSDKFDRYADGGVVVNSDTYV